jgi:hypothetical protein
MGNPAPNAIWTILIGTAFFVSTAQIAGMWPNVGPLPDSVNAQGKRDLPQQEDGIGCSQRR